MLTDSKDVEWEAFMRKSRPFDTSFYLRANSEYDKIVETAIVQRECSKHLTCI